MNPNRKLTTLLFNPFVYIAGAQSLFLGLAAILVTGLIAVLGRTHFDGVLDFHAGAPAQSWFFLGEGLIDWLCLAGTLLVIGKFVSKTSFRAIDVLGTQALARWPALLIGLVTLPNAFRRFIEELLQTGGKLESNLVDLGIFCAVLLAVILLLSWMVALMYNGYSVSCNLRGGKAIGTFIGGLVLAEILSKVALYGLLSLGTLNAAPGGSTAAAPGTDAQTNAVTAAQAWLVKIDRGDYSQSWDDASAFFKSKVTQKSWQEAMGTFRKPLGNLVSRCLKTAQAATQLPGAPDGTYVVMQFDTSFAEKKPAIETVTFELGKDEVWRASGYYIK